MKNKTANNEVQEVVQTTIETPKTSNYRKVGYHVVGVAKCGLMTLGALTLVGLVYSAFTGEDQEEEV